MITLTSAILCAGWVIVKKLNTTFILCASDSHKHAYTQKRDCAFFYNDYNYTVNISRLTFGL